MQNPVPDNVRKAERAAIPAGSILSRARIAGACYYVLAFLIGFSLCEVYGRSVDDPLDHPYPVTLALSYPAVFFAAGHGMGVAPPATIPGMEDFLERRVNSFDTSNIPEDVQLSPMTTPFELTHIYMIYALGIFWRLFGVSVDTMVHLCAFFCGLSGLAVYGLFRLGLSRMLSLFGAFFVVSSPAILYMCLNVRDFGKVPFILLVSFLALRLAVRETSGKRFLIFSALLGGIAGMGIGFRWDVMICLPIAVLVLAWAAPVSSTHPVRVRVVAMALFFACFLPVGWPVLKGAALEGFQVSVHSFLMGISGEIESKIDFGGSSYEQTLYGDPCAYAETNVYARRTGFDGPMHNPPTAEYRSVHGDLNTPLLVDPALHYTGAEHARFGGMLLERLLLDFPADIFARALRAAVSLYDVPVKMAGEMSRVNADFPAWLQLIFSLQGLVAVLIKYLGLLCVSLMVVGISARNFRLAVFLAVILLWFTGYPSILYEFRHVAYLIFIPLGAMMVCGERTVKRLYGRSRGFEDVGSQSGTSRDLFPVNTVDESVKHGAETRDAGEAVSAGAGAVLPENRKKAIFTMMTFVVLAFLALSVPFCLFRAWQVRQVHALADRLDATEREPVAVQTIMEDGQVLVQPVEELPGLAKADALPAGETAWQYVAAVFDTGGKDIPVTITYDPERIINDFTRPLTLWGSSDGRSGRVTLFFPVYAATTVYSPEVLENFLKTVDITPWREAIDPARPIEEQPVWKPSKFLGLSFPKEYQENFVGFYIVDKLEGLTYLPLFQVPDNRAYLRPYKTGPWERKIRGCLASRR